MTPLVALTGEYYRHPLQPDESNSRGLVLGARALEDRLQTSFKSLPKVELHDDSSRLEWYQPTSVVPDIHFYSLELSPDNAYVMGRRVCLYHVNIIPLVFYTYYAQERC